MIIALGHKVAASAFLTMPVLTRHAKAHICHLDALPVELVTEILYRTPCYTHDSLRATCSTFRTIIDSAADGSAEGRGDGGGGDSAADGSGFHETRLANGHADSALLAFGGYDSGGSDSHHRGMAALVDGQWTYLADPPAWGRDLYHGLVHDRLVLVGGGQSRWGEYTPDGLQVHTYDLVQDEWFRLSPKNPPAHSREGAACAAVGDKIIIAGGMEEDWGGDDDPYELTASVLALTISTSKRVKWSELAPLPHAVTSALSFSLGGRFYVAGGSAAGNGFSAQEHRLPHLQMLDLESGAWTQRAELPLLDFDGGGAHSGRFYAIRLNRPNKSETRDTEEQYDRPPPSIYAYDPEADAWELQPPLAGNIPELLEAVGYKEIAVTSCAAGLMVLGRGDGTAALLKITDGRVVSASYLSDEDWGERISAFAQDHFLDGLNAASFELSAHCQPLLRSWAEEIEEMQSNIEDEWRWEVEQNGEAEENTPQTPNLDAARAWLTQSGLPLAAERHAMWLAQRERERQAGGVAVTW